MYMKLLQLELTVAYFGDKSLTSNWKTYRKSIPRSSLGFISAILIKMSQTLFTKCSGMIRRVSSGSWYKKRAIKLQNRSVSVTISSWNKATSLERSRLTKLFKSGSERASSGLRELIVQYRCRICRKRSSCWLNIGTMPKAKDRVVKKKQVGTKSFFGL